MTKEELFKALGDIDPVSVQNAEKYHGKKKAFPAKWIALAACAAIAAGLFFGLPALRTGSENQKNPSVDAPSISEKPEKQPEQTADGKTTGNVNRPEGVKAFMAAYPDPVAQAMNASLYMQSDAHSQWWLAYRELIAQSAPLQPELFGYYESIMQQLLTAEDDNTVCSPINTYMAFAMLAEVTDGNTRQQLLDLLGAPDIEALRTTVSAVWSSSYIDTPTLKSLLANSLWLDSATAYNDAALKRLAEQYFASSFCGTPGSEEMDRALRTWTDSNTGGLLTDHTDKLSIDPGTVLELVSTIYFKAMWQSDFRIEDTAEETFHGTRGDTTAEMMKRTDVRSVCRTDNFTALGLSLRDGGSVYFYLPAEHADVNTLLTDPELMKPVRHADDDPSIYTLEVHLSVPKFRVACQTDLLGAAQALGITDALDSSLADFTPLTDEKDRICLNRANHSAMVEINEEGVSGAAFTDVATGTGGFFPDEELDFVLDRPFLFLVTGMDGTILFSGIIRNID